jgi:hypothetical protein
MDIYQSVYNYCTAEGIKKNLDIIFDVSPRGPIGKFSEENLVIFNHIAFTGGVQLNDLFIRSSRFSGIDFKIPSFDSYVKDNEYTHRKTLLSAHFLNGIDILIGKRCDYFTLLRDPVSHILSVLTTKSDYLTGSSNEIWRNIAKNLDFWEKEVGHINLQAFEIATDYSDKKHKSIPGSDDVPIHFYKNYISTNANQLLNIANEKIRDKYLMVGITELYEETIFLFFARLGIKKAVLWRPGFFSYWRPARFEVPIFVQEKIKSLTTADHSLYYEHRNKLENDFFESEFNSEFTKYKIFSRDHLLKLHMEFSERIELGRTLSAINNNPARKIEELTHVIEFKNSLEDLITSELPNSRINKIIRSISRRIEQRFKKA